MISAVSWVKWKHIKKVNFTGPFLYSFSIKKGSCFYSRDPLINITRRDYGPIPVAAIKEKVKQMLKQVSEGYRKRWVLVANSKKCFGFSIRQRLIMDLLSMNLIM